MHRVFDALVTSAAADVARHRFAYLIVTGLWIIHQQRSCLHDLPGLAIAALRHIDLPPRFLNGVIAGRMQAFDGSDVAVGGIRDGSDAGADGLLVHDHGTRAAERHAASAL